MGPVGLGEVADRARKGKQERGRKKYTGDETEMRQRRRSGLRERRGRTTEDVETGELRGGGQGDRRGPGRGAEDRHWENMRGTRSRAAAEGKVEGGGTCREPSPGSCCVCVPAGLVALRPPGAQGHPRAPCWGPSYRPVGLGLHAPHGSTTRTRAPCLVGPTSPVTLRLGTALLPPTPRPYSGLPVLQEPQHAWCVPALVMCPLTPVTPL